MSSVLKGRLGVHGVLERAGNEVHVNILFYFSSVIVVLRDTNVGVSPRTGRSLKATCDYHLLRATRS